MNYTLVNPSGTIVQSREFDGPPPTLAPVKGKWLPDNPPAYNPLTHSCVRSATQSVGNASVDYLVTPLPLEQVQERKRAELQQARDQAAAANVTVQGKVFSAEPKTADLFAKLADRKRRGKSPTLTAIFDVNGSPVPPNPTTLEAIEDAIAEQVEDAWNKYGTLVGQVMAATNNTQVEAIAW